MSKKEVDGPESPREKPCIHEIRFGLLAAGRIGKDCQETCAIDICHFEKKKKKKKKKRKVDETCIRCRCRSEILVYCQLRLNRRKRRRLLTRGNETAAACL